jgi:hypothetical protein
MANQSFLHNQLDQKLYEVFVVKPNDLGSRRLTALYKIITKRFKVMPFLYIVPLSLIVAIVAYILFGHLIVKLTTLLQNGF